MKILNSLQIKGVDIATIHNEPVESIDLMERASRAFYNRFVELCPNYPVVVLAGPGNNGGDALAVARMLLEDKRKVRVIVFKVRDNKLSEDASINLNRLMQNYSDVIAEADEQVRLNITSEEWIIDGLFGSGLNKPVTGVYAEVIQEINNADNPVVSIDVPSGLYCENNSDENLQTCIKATYTITFQIPKLAFFFSDNEAYVGNWEVVDIGLNQEAIDNSDTSYYLTEESDISRLLIKRNRFDHKGKFGHALLMSGSYGKMGAAVLASKACMKTGVGLLTTHVPRLGYNIIQTAVPEAMASIDRSDILISEHPALEEFDAIGIGPGIGIKPNTITALFELMQQLNNKPLVLDADAINILSKDQRCYDAIPESSILTPHPGELDRLLGKSTNASERLQKAIDFAKEKHVVIILKGANTAVINADGECWFNSTGNAGMATAGSGDVLTGIVLSFLAQSYSPFDAARVAVYVHGLSADEFIKTASMESLTASDIIDCLNKAFYRFKNK
ncbi:NAD(P)H-hydrate dehydratase [Marinilabiliaceae bacterium A049]|nr:NAD(P)H-hydrate dehydratase [Marinilabiliaceae bacterium A049]